MFVHGYIYICLYLCMCVNLRVTAASNLCPFKDQVSLSSS